MRTLGVARGEMRNDFAKAGRAGVDVAAQVPTLASAVAGGTMRRLADYTVGLVIVLVHLVMMSRANETLALEERRR